MAISMMLTIGRPADDQRAGQPPAELDSGPSAGVRSPAGEALESDHEMIDFWEPRDSLGFLASFG
ncbi:MAG TPA: hypothetical protein VIJ51_03400 [Solirubrobacteraceae bacterium]